MHKKTLVATLIIFMAGAMATQAASSKEKSQSPEENPVIQRQTSVKPKQADQEKEKAQGKENFQSKNPDAQKTIQTRQETKTKNQGEEQQLKLQEQLKVMTKTPEEFKKMVNEKAKELKASLRNKNNKEKNIYQHQYRVKLAAQTIFGMQNFLGEKLGPKAAEIAKQLDSSVKATIMAEKKIQNRNRIIRFFVGGDKKAAAEIKREVQQNRKRIQELKKVYQECTDCDEQIKEMLKEEIQTIEQEQIRLKQLADKEEKSNGLIGFLFGWLF